MLSLKLHHEVAHAAAVHYQLRPEEVEVTTTRDLAHGDYATNVALRVASKWGVTPRQAADTLLAELQQSKFVLKNFSKVEIAGPGFINFYLKPEVVAKELSTVFTNRKVIVEYSSPNIAKPMHVGHIRSTIIGEALANMYEALGAKVVRLNHLGDWGTQFGKLIAAYKMWGKASAVKKHPIDEMLALYVRFHEEMKENPELERQGQEEFKKLEEGDKENRRLWEWFRAESLKEFDKLYKRLGVKFTHLTGESFYESALPAVVTDLVKRKIAVKNDDGSVVVHLVQESLPPMLVQKSDGASLYATRDLATIRYRVQHFKPKDILYVVANQQALHFEQLFACAVRAGYIPGVELQHIKFGLVLGEDGQKMATREGRIIRLEELLDKAVAGARKIVEQKNPKLTVREKSLIAEVVGVGAIKYNDLSQNRNTDIAFNWSKMLAVDGNSGPYLQYSYVRLKSILRKAVGNSKKAVFKPTPISVPSLAVATPADLTMLRLITRYPEAILRAVDDKAPHLLAAYLYELAEAVNSFYHSSPVLNASVQLKLLRLNIVYHAAEVLKDGLGILGIGVVEKM